MEESLYNWLKINEIDYLLHTHKPVFTVAEAKEFTGHIPGLHCKNLFLVHSKDHTFFLVTLPAIKQVKILEISKILSLKKLSFAKADDLLKILGLEPGSVSPLGLLNDTQNSVTYLIDKDVWDADKVCFHPNINSETLEINKNDFHKLIEKTGNNFLISEI